MPFIHFAITANWITETKSLNSLVVHFKIRSNFWYQTWIRSSSAAKAARRKRSSSLKRQPSAIRRQTSRRTINHQAAGKSINTSEARKQSNESNLMGTLIGHHRYTGKPRQLISRRKSYQRAMNHQNLTKTSRQNAIR